MPPHTGRLIDYSTTDFPFAAAIGEALQVDDLSKIHELQNYELFARANDQKTVWHQRYYSNFETLIAPVYREFVKAVVGPQFSEPMACQKIPTFRTHLPDNIGVGEFHRDRDYQHPEGEINFLLPATDAWGTNTMWIESVEGAEDFQPAEIKYGQVYTFDGRNLKHGNKVNTTGSTRVSFDFRVIPLRLSTQSTGASINMGTRFVLGEYYVAVDG